VISATLYYKVVFVGYADQIAPVIGFFLPHAAADNTLQQLQH
jgi:hypothetical protein